MPWRYGNFFGDVTRIDDELIWDREVHHEELEGFFPSNYIVLPYFCSDDRANDLPVVRIDELDGISEDAIGDKIESIADRLDNPLPLQSIDGLCNTSILTDDITSTWVDEITDILNCDDFSHFFLQFFDDFV